MPALDIEELVKALGDDEPSGEDLEYDPEFLELERKAKLKDDDVIGDVVVAAEEPDWREVKKIALTLFERTRDLRVAAYLSKAVLRTDGLEGFASAVKLISTLLEELWPSLHPELDEDDDDDPTFRINSIQELCDVPTVLNAVRTTPLVQARGLGSFALRDLLIASGELSPRDDEKPPDPATLDAAFMASELEPLQQIQFAVSEMVDSIKRIETTVREKATGGMTVNLDPLAKMVRQIDGILKDQLARRDGGASAGEAGDAAEGESAPGDGAEGAPAGGGAPAVKRLSGDINTRDDVLRAIDKICDYYRRSEPSSPIPILMERAKRLVTMDFMQIIQNMASDAVDQVENIRGPLEEDED